MHGHTGSKIKEFSRLLKRATQRGDLGEIVKAETELDKWLDKDEILWAQRSRVSWLSEGDRNTKYFHGKASQHRQRNKITSIKDDKECLFEGQQQVAQEAIRYFSEPFTASRGNVDWKIGVGETGF